MDLQTNFQQEKSLLNLKVEILLFLRKNKGNQHIIYPGLLVKKFNRTKGAISQALKDLVNQELIIYEIYEGQQKRRYRKKIKLTKEGVMFTAQLLFKGLNDIEIQAIKALNLKF